MFMRILQILVGCQPPFEVGRSNLNAPDLWTIRLTRKVIILAR